LFFEKKLTKEILEKRFFFWGLSKKLGFSIEKALTGQQNSMNSQTIQSENLVLYNS
jgi:hypothetical protein